MIKVSSKFIFLILSIFSLSYSQSISDIKIGIVHNGLTKKLIYSHDKNFYPIQDWELFFLNRKISYAVIDDEEIASGDLSDIDVLILPSVEVLPLTAQNKLNEFLKNGKGILVFGQLGLYTENGSKSNSNFLLNNGGFGVENLIIGDEISESIKLNTSNVICRNVNFDDNLLVMNQYAPLVANVIDKSVKSCGIYGVNEIHEKEKNKSGIVFSEKNNSKVVWFGFQYSQIGSSNKRGSVLEKIIFNSIEWLSQKPVVMLNRWPAEYKLPVLLNCVLANKSSVTSQNLDQLQSADVLINFFLEMETINSDTGILSKLNKIGDINLYLNSNKFGNLNSDFEFDNTYEKLYKISRQNQFGIRLDNFYSDELPGEIINSKFGFYSLSDEKIIISKPGHSNEDKLEDLPVKPGYYLMRGRDERSILDTISKIADNIPNEELLILGLVDQSKPGENFKTLDYLEPTIEILKKKDAWITTYSNLINWVSNWQNLFVTATKLQEKNNFEINIENRNQNDVNDLVLTLLPPTGKANPKLLGTDLILTYDRKSGTYLISIPKILAGTREILNIHFGDHNFQN